MITGFNTDIQYEGVTYHVQTEDKGLGSPLILSLVYVGGTIVASKRTPYSDLVEVGFDELALTERLQRQHKLICAAIRAGRIEDLKKMGADAPARGKTAAKGKRRAESPGAERPEVNGLRDRPQSPINGNVRHDAAETAPERAATIPSLSGAKTGKAEPSPAQAPTVGEPSDLYNGIVAVVEPLKLTLLDEEGEFRAGESATFKIRVGRGGYGRDGSVAGASVTLKVLGTTFRPLILTATTDSAGFAVVRVLLPQFTSGRSAIIIRAVSDGEAVELRRIIHRA